MKSGGVYRACAPVNLELARHSYTPRNRATMVVASSSVVVACLCCYAYSFLQPYAVPPPHGDHYDLVQGGRCCLIAVLRQDLFCTLFKCFGLIRGHSCFTQERWVLGCWFRSGKDILVLIVACGKRFPEHTLPVSFFELCVIYVSLWVCNLD